MAAINNIATTDAYGTASSGAYLETGQARAINVIITNAAVYMNVASWPGGGAPDWSSDNEFLPPGGYYFEAGDTKPHKALDAVRFKSAAAGVPGRVSVKA